jgi:WD40 repeat protein
MLIWKAHRRYIDALAFSPDGSRLAVAGSYLSCRLIDAGTGARLWDRDSCSSFGLSLAFTPAGDVLSRGLGVSLRSARGTERDLSESWCRSFGLAPDGRTVYVADGGTNDPIQRYNLRSGRAAGTINLRSGGINRIAVSPDGRFVATVGCKRFSLLSANRFEVLASVAERALSSGAFALAFHPSGRSLVYTAGRTLCVWEVPPAKQEGSTGAARETHRVRLEAKHFMDAAFTPDGNRLLTVSKEGVVRVWDTATWACERALAWDVGPLRAVAVSRDGTRGAAAGDTGRVVVWDLDL